MKKMKRRKGLFFMGFCLVAVALAVMFLPVREAFVKAKESRSADERKTVALLQIEETAKAEEAVKTEKAAKAGKTVKIEEAAQKEKTPPKWNKATVYVAGDRVIRNGIVYEAAWWTLGEDPAKQQDEWSVWKKVTESEAPKQESQKQENQKTENQKPDAKEPATKEAASKDIETKTTEASKKEQTKSSLPEHLITGYWQNFDNGAACLKISDVPEGYGLIAVAFAESTRTPGKVTFHLDETLCGRLGGYTKKQFIKDIKAAKKKGQHVILSVGGENGTVSVLNTKEAKRFADSLYQLMEEYGFEGVDIDLEHGIHADYMEQALRRLSQKAGDGLIITMAPQTLDMQNTQTEYFKLALGIQDILTIVNTQYYNSGTMLGADGKVYAQGSVDFLTALAAIQLEQGLRPDQIGLGVPASSKGAGSGYVSPSVVNKALNCLAKGKKGGSYQPEKKYPKLRGAMCWSINWDAANDYEFLEGVLPTIKKLK